MVRGKREQNRSIALKAKTESSDEDSSTFDKQPHYERIVIPKSKDDKNGKGEIKCFKCGDPNHITEECPKLSRNYNQRAFVGGSWSDSDEDEERTKDEKCLMAKASNEVLSETEFFSDDHSSLDEKDAEIENIIELLQKIESAYATPKAHLPYGMFLTRLFRHVTEHYPHHDNGIYDVVDRVMRPLALGQTRDDDEVDGASRASTPSPTTYLNSLGPLDYQQYDVPTSFEQNDDLLFERQTDLLNQTQQMHKELRGGFKLFGKALQGVFGKKKK
ncbi:zf-CCHC domain-containing protein [Tanacetum coccineum]